jgi:hypothetical protein
MPGKNFVTVVLAAGVGLAAFFRFPFPDKNGLLQLLLLQKPVLFQALKAAYVAMLFTTPYIALSVVASLAYIFLVRPGNSAGLAHLPPYPDPSTRDKLFVVIGEIHHAKKPEPAQNPHWLTIPERGLFTGIAIFGAIGSGKTSGCMYPFTDQLLAFRAKDPERRIGGLILEVKGDFCHKIKTILEARGRANDYVEISLDCPYRYNPLYNDLDAYALAYGIASLLNNLFGRGKEPFWQQAYTNLVKFIILLHKVLYDYVTLFDVYEGAVCALNFPVATNPGLAKAVGTMMKQDFQRAVLNRIPRIERQPEKPWREVLFLCDEYHSFATVGENDPSGDEKFFALSRQAKCIPIVATQSISSLRSTLPGESWRTLLQTFRTKIFLSLSDDFSAKTASDLCGKEEQLKLNYSLSEHGQDAGVSMLTGQATAHRATVGTSKGYNLQRDFIFEPKIFTELKNAQSVVLAYDGLNPWPPSYCYLKPYYLDPNMSYFEQLVKGEL